MEKVLQVNSLSYSERTFYEIRRLYISYYDKETRAVSDNVKMLACADKSKRWLNK